jgi:hypothetical protein
VKRRTIGAVLALSGACASPIPAEAQACIALWNEGGPRGVIAAEGYTEADVNAGENKASQRECGFRFHSASGEPWRIYGAIIEDDAVVGDWVSVTGSQWGDDSPEGDVDVTVGVAPDGSLDN